MAVPHYEIFVRNNLFNVETVVDRYQKLEFREIYNDTGGFVLEMPADEESIEVMKKLYDGEDEVSGGFSGIIVTRNSKVVFSGAFRGYEQTGNFSDEDDQDIITWFGIDDTGILASRIIMVPFTRNTDRSRFIAPSNQGWPIWTFPQKNPTLSVAENERTVSQVLFTTFADNIGFRAPRQTQINPSTGQPYDSNAFANRKIDDLFMNPPAALGPPSSIRGRYQNLLKQTQELAEFKGDPAWATTHTNYRGLQFRIRQLKKPILVEKFDIKPGSSDPPVAPLKIDPQPDPLPETPPAGTEFKKIQLDIFQPRDRRNRVVFSQGYRNIGSYRILRKSPQSTFIVIGGQNNDSDKISGLPNPTEKRVYKENDPRTRWFAHIGSDKMNRFGLWEKFLDRRDIQYGEESIDTASSTTGPNPNPFPNTYPHFYDDETGVDTSTGPTSQKDKQKRNFDLMESEFVQAINNKFTEDDLVIEAEIVPINQRPTRYFEDYLVGDLVTVILPGEKPVEAKVREAVITLTKEEGEVVKAVIGTENASTKIQISDQIEKTKVNVNHLNESR